MSLKYILFSLTGYGEVVPLGPNYLASYAAGVRTGIKYVYLANENYFKTCMLHEW